MLDDIMKLASTNANRQFEVLEKIAINIANINTTGYKNKRFEQYLINDNQLAGSTRIDTSQGAIRVTNRPLDVAIDGSGYVPVTQPDGTTAYTRDGSFTLNSQGYIITQRGDIVGNGIQVPNEYSDIQIHPDGQVLIRTSKHADFKEIGKISLVRFANPEGLTNIGYNKMAASGASGTAVSETESKVKQGSLEQANVNVHEQVDQILRLNAGLISNMRIIKFVDDLYRQSVNLKQ